MPDGERVTTGSEPPFTLRRCRECGFTSLSTAAWLSGRCVRCLKPVMPESISVVEESRLREAEAERDLMERANETSMELADDLAGDVERLEAELREARQAARDELLRVYMIALNACDLAVLAGREDRERELRGELVAFADENPWVLSHVPDPDRARRKCLVKYERESKRVQRARKREQVAAMAVLEKNTGNTERA